MNTTSRVTPLREVGQDRGHPSLPADTEIEQSLLGALLLQNGAYGTVADFLRPEHFANAVHSRIFEAIGKLIERGDPANPATLRNLFDQDGALADIGGALYLARLVESAVTVMNAPFYARTILDLHLRRELIAIGQEMIAKACQIDLDVQASNIAAEADEALDAIVVQGTPRQRSGTVGDAVRRAVADTEQAYQSEGKTSGVRTGLIDLDAALGGLAPGDLIVLPAAPSMGKTSLLLEIGNYLARNDEPVGICELEQSAPQLAQRLLAREADVSVSKQRGGNLDPMYEWPRYLKAAERVAPLPIYIDDTPAMSLADIRRQARRWRSRHGIKLLAIDHLQLMRGDRKEGRRLEIDDFADGLKSLAKELDIPILLLSQLNRALAQRDNKRPVLSDIRESGSVEAAADVVMFIYREEYYLAQSEPARRDGEADDRYNDRYDRWKERLEAMLGVAEIIIAKNRHGATKTVRLHWDGAMMSFDNYIGPERLPQSDY